MIAWIRNKLRAWLLDVEDDSVSTRLRIQNPGGDVIYGDVMRVQGPYLVVATTTGLRMLLEHHVVDPEHFRKLWKKMNLDQNYTWEDGTPLE